MDFEYTYDDFDEFIEDAKRGFKNADPRSVYTWVRRGEWDCTYRKNRSENDRELLKRAKKDPRFADLRKQNVQRVERESKVKAS